MSNTKAKANEKIPYTYPAEWFAANQGQKPIIRILTSKDVSLATLRQAVYQAIKTMGDFELDLALSYLYQVTRNIKVQLDNDWISYGIVIGENGTYVDPFSPLEVITAADTIKGMQTVEGSDATEKDDKWMITLICLIYRLSRASFPKHKNKLQNHGLHILKTRGCTLSDINLANLPSQIFNWIKNKNYKKTIASFDMFFNKFRMNEYAICRYGTIVSRYRDCAALLSYYSTCKNLGLTKAGDLLDWFFTDALQANANTLFKRSKEEYGQYDSYFMYQMDLGLTQKSAYCATVNQAIYFVTNLVSAILLDGRGLRAHKTLDDDFDIITHTLNAKIIGYVFSTSFSLCMVFLSTELFEQKALECKSTEPEKPAEPTADSAVVPKGQNASEWFRYFKKNQFQIPDYMSKWYGKLRCGIPIVRKNTIGEFLKEN